MSIDLKEEAWRLLLVERCVELEDHREVFERAAFELERTLGYDLDVLGFSSSDDFDANQLIEAVREYEKETNQQHGDDGDAPP